MEFKFNFFKKHRAEFKVEVYTVYQPIVDIATWDVVGYEALARSETETPVEMFRRSYEKGLVIPFVSSGRCNSFYPRIEKHIKELRLGSQVQFLGFVSPLELQCLYRLCRCVVIPTRFEAASFPVWDAFLAGTPVACSNVTSLPQQVGDAALVFDPEDTQAIANAIERLWTDQTLCRELIERGRTNVARFSWNRTARQFRAHYRRIAGRPMSDEDRRLLQAPPLL